MFSRDIISDLRKWAANEHRKPLILRGARQVGKTSVVKQFAIEFDTFLYVNLEERNNRRIFDEFVSLEQLIIRLFASQGKNQNNGKTLIFFDEIQYSPEAIEQLRYFYEQRPDLYVIAAGSLLESLIDVHTSFPVGRVQYMALRPVSFREFAKALGHKSIIDLIEKQPSESHAFHDLLMALFKNYMLVGGMPEAVNQFVESKDIVSLNDVFDTLLISYKDDIEKYSSNKTQTEIIRFLMDNLWPLAGQSISMTHIQGSNYKSREVGEALRTIEKAMLIELIYPNSNISLPLVQQHTRAPKLMVLDTGLVNYFSHIQKDILNADDILDTWKGAIAEHVVGQELLTLSNSVLAHRNFWSRERSSAEIDFEYCYEGQIVPIEVKTGHNSKLRSLHSFVDESKCDVAIRVWSDEFRIDNIKTINNTPFTLISLPFYLVGFLPSILSNFISPILGNKGALNK